MTVPFLSQVADSAASAISHVGTRADSVGVAAQNLLQHIDAPPSVKAKVFEYIETIAEAMGVAVGQVWWVLVKQSIFLGVGQVFGAIMLATIALVFIRKVSQVLSPTSQPATMHTVQVGKTSFKLQPVQDNPRKRIYVLIPAWFVGCWVVGIATATIVHAIPMIFNPGYWALNRVLTALQHR
jgi:hypothetical protein